MCTTCGCGKAEVKIEGEAHGHEHRHADGTVHSHPHSHDGEHQHDHGQHAHEHRHADGTIHSHPHEKEHSHDHGEHAHEHRHPDGTVHSHPHSHDGEHSHDPVDGRDHVHFGLGPAGAHAPGLSQERMVRIEQDILAKNSEYAGQNRRSFADRGIFALNLVSSPGSGKTTLLCRTIEGLKGRLKVAVIEGDQQTSRDADRIRATGARAVQINTGKGCHLDAHMVGHAAERLELDDDSVLMIENVGNLVCPSSFDLGEAHKVVILAVTEGEDKPLKYPDMFAASDIMLLNKTDLLPYTSFNVPLCIEYARRINSNIRVILTSSVNGEGMQEWLDWITAGAAAARGRRSDSVDALRRRIAELEAQLGKR
ncbi:MAG TPA: hydrogenase nickel incorporation protein HypB [Burkholderiales bacterium]|nr:hydrogenase nickel incorporation protein HypB [Burkholderiales bacterium]